MSERGRPQEAMQECEAAIAISVTALPEISRRCCTVGRPSLASSGYVLRISSDITTYLVFTVVVLPIDKKYNPNFNVIKFILFV